MTVASLAPMGVEILWFVRPLPCGRGGHFPVEWVDTFSVDSVVTFNGIVREECTLLHRHMFKAIFRVA